MACGTRPRALVRCGGAAHSALVYTLHCVVLLR